MLVDAHDRDHLTHLLSRRALVAASATSLALAGIRPTAAQDATPAPEPVSGGTLVVGVQGDPTELDPALVILDAASLVTDLVYEGLVHEGVDLQPEPRVASEWTISDDGLIYTFTLREGVKFHNGRDLVAEDVKYSIERVQNPDSRSPWSPYAATITGIETPDERTVVLTLDAPDATLMASLGRRGLAIVPREEVEVNGDLRLVMVGSGAFRFVEYVPNSLIRLERNPDYWDAPKPYLDVLELQIVPDDTARSTALMSDTVQFIEATPAKDIPLIEVDPNLKMLGDTTTNLRWIVFNTRRAPLDNPDVRRAIANGIVRQEIIDTAVFGYGTPLHGVYPKDYWAGWPDDAPAGDPEAAATELAALNLPADWQPGILTWAEYDFLSATSVVVQEQLRRMGIESEIEPEENATYLERHFSGDFDIAVMGAGGYIDPHDFLGQTLGTGGVTNAAGYSNADLDALFAEGISEMDQEARREIYLKIQQHIIDEAPWVMLYTSNVWESMRADVHGFRHSMAGYLTTLRETWLENGGQPT